MSHDVYYEFFQTPEQKRRSSARGGKSTARHRRERQEGAMDSPTEPPSSEAEPGPDRETTTAAIALLDVQYPWLRGAEKRFSNRWQRAAG